MDEKVIIQKLSMKHNLPIQTIEEIVFSQFKFAADVIKSGEFESIRIPYFGKFTAHPTRIKYLLEHHERTANNNGE
jgi:nucleoid DNA-binding protein